VIDTLVVNEQHVSSRSSVYVRRVRLLVWQLSAPRPTSQLPGASSVVQVRPVDRQSLSSLKHRNSPAHAPVYECGEAIDHVAVSSLSTSISTPLLTLQYTSATIVIGNFAARNLSNSVLIPQLTPSNATGAIDRPPADRRATSTSARPAAIL
jgi:hypothetical protein